MSAPYVTGSQPDLNQTLDSAKALDRFLGEAISDFAQPPAQPKGPALMATGNGLRRLKNLSETLVKSVDDHCDKVATQLQKDHDEAIALADNVVDAVGGGFKDASTELKDMLNQITNGDTNG